MIRTLKRTAAAILALLMLGMTPVYAVTDAEKATQKANQITCEGGKAGNLETDGVEVSKTIAPTDIENYFDITLTAKTQMTYDKSRVEDAHVVIVLDMSNTMNYGFEEDKVPTGSDPSRYDSAIEAVNEFIDGFIEITLEDSTADRMIGVAAFNTNGHNISADDSHSNGMFSAQSIIGEKESKAFKDDIKMKTDAIMKQIEIVDGREVGYGSLKCRFTNMEAGLQVAWDMLKNSRKNGEKVKNEIIIFITDGYPTTYLKNTNGIGDYEGYEPYSTSGTIGTDGVFHDASEKATSIQTGGVYCQYGVDYSDKAAEKATTKAKQIKKDSVQIYPIGVMVTNAHIYDYEKTNYETFTTKDKNGNDVVHTNGNVGYGQFSTIDTDGNNTVEGNYYIKKLEDWLGGTDLHINNGIGSGRYTSVESATALKSALQNLVGNANNFVGVGSTALSTTDPVTVNDASDDVAFVGFYNKAGTSSSAYSDGTTVLSGSSVQWNADGAENTAECNKDSGGNDVITWELENSAYTETEKYNEGGSATDWTTKTVTRTYTLKYRVRLENEKTSFVPEKNYATNGDTILKYSQTTVNDDGTIETKEETIHYPVPQVKGYLGSFSFTKVDTDTRQPLSRAEFTLRHDGEGCEVCTGDAKIDNVTVTSDGNGRVEFTNIPSGHTYTLSEPDAYPLHHELGEAYAVTVAYGQVTVEEKVEEATTHFFRDNDDNITITNDTVLPGDVEVKLTKMVDGSKPGAWLDGKFTFSLTDNKTGEVRYTSAVGGSGTFVLNYKGADKDTYTYTLREVRGSGRYYYDSTVYTVRVTLTDKKDNTGDYEATVTCYRGEVGEDGAFGEQVNGAVFNNITRHNHTHTEEEVPPVPEEIPKSGGMSALGIAIGLAAAAAVVSRKRRK